MEPGTATEGLVVRVMQGHERVNEIGTIRKIIPATDHRIEHAEIDFAHGSPPVGIAGMSASSGGPPGLAEIPTMNIAREVARSEIPKPGVRPVTGDEMVQERPLSKDQVMSAAHQQGQHEDRKRPGCPLCQTTPAKKKEKTE